jgi:hypothetical protein
MSRRGRDALPGGRRRRRRLGGVAAAALTITLAAAGPAAGLASEVSPQIDPGTGLASWTLRSGSLSVDLIQRLPDQTRAFFIGRGFAAASADQLARACVFQAIMANSGRSAQGPAVAIDLRRWRMDAGKGPEPLPVEATWQPRWAAAGLSQAARIAFRWALFPTEQIFMPGDHGWGMIPFGPTPDTRFDLSVVWSEDGVERTARLPAIHCTPDRSISPTETTP